MKIQWSAGARTVLAVLVSGVAANAAILGTYSDRASWEAVVSAGTQVDIPFATPVVFNFTNAGLPSGGVGFVGFYNEGAANFTYRNNLALGAESSLNLASYGFAMIGGGTGSIVNFSAGLNVTPVAGSRAIGFDFGGYYELTAGGRSNSTSSTEFLVRVYEGGVLSNSYTVNGADRPNLAFFGVATSGDISGVEILTRNITGADGAYVILDNYSYGNTTLTGGGGEPPSGGGDLPEPSTYVMAGVGLLSLFVLRRKA